MDNTINCILEELANYNVSFEENISKICTINDEFKTPITQIRDDFKKVSDCLRVCHINPTSVQAHRDEIFRLAEGTDMDAIGVSESNMKKNTLKSRITLPGYKLFRKDRTYADRGGVCLYLKEHIKAKKINLKYEDEAPELICVEAEINKTKILMGVLYKPPRFPYRVLENVMEELAFLTTKYEHTILMGDFNIDQLKKDKPAYKYLYNSFIQPLQLKQIITEPTWITKDKESLIDLMMVTSLENVKTSGVADFLGINQHCLTYLAYGVKRQKNKPQYIMRRDYRNFSETEYCKDMENAPWGNIYSYEEHEIDEQVTIMENIFTEIIDRHAPMRRIKIRKPAPTQWINDEIIQAMDQRDKYKAKFNKYRDPLILETYKTLKNQVNYLVRKAKYKDFNERINAKVKDSKTFHLALKTCSVIDSKKKKSEEVSYDPDKLNACFTKHNNANVDDDMIKEEIEKITANRSPFSLYFRQVSEVEVKKIIRSFKSNSAGIDGINTFFVKKSLNYSIHALTELINSSIKWSVFPERWKRAIVIPIPKCDEPTSEKDYRPISLLIVFAKILEKVIAIQLIEYFLNSGLLNKFQSAYKKYHSTTTALLHILDEILKSLNNNEITVMTLLDYSKAFDTANHALILAKLKALGLTESACKWISSYLHERKQKVSTTKGVSEEITLKNGVPQGSILGPILFTVLTSDLHKCLQHCKYHCYADDTQLYKSGTVNDIHIIIRQLNTDLDSVSKFSKTNCLKLNYDKNKFIIFASRTNLNLINNMVLEPITIDEQIVERETVVRNLGLYMDEELTFEYHINDLVKRAFGKLKTAWKCGKFLSETSKRIITDSYILSQFNYLDIIWRTCTKRMWDKIQGLQNNCIRFIFKLRKYDHISAEFQKLNTLNMHNRTILHALTYMFKCVNHKAPSYLTEKIQYVSNIHDHDTRARNEILCTQFNNRYGKYNFFNEVGSIYNKFTSKVDFKVNCSTFTFKKKVANYLLGCQQRGVHHQLT